MFYLLKTNSKLQDLFINYLFFYKLDMYYNLLFFNCMLVHNRIVATSSVLCSFSTLHTFLSAEQMHMDHKASSL